MALRIFFVALRDIFYTKSHEVFTKGHEVLQDETFKVICNSCGIDLTIFRSKKVTCHGKPTIRSIRYPVDMILDLLPSGMTFRGNYQRFDYSYLLDNLETLSKH
ncbi:MAG: DUF433 domain-containing protein [Bacteroidetes bacterium]|nr:DUF433 domain-containing protein [Bacteroidota bacterium]